MKQRPLSPTSVVFERPAWQSYGFAVLMVCAALLARWSLDLYTGDAVPLATMYIGVAFAVWFGGWKPAAFVVVAGYVAALWLFQPPRLTFKLWESFGVLRTVLYFGSCAITIYLCESMRRAQRRHAASEAKVMSILDNMHGCFMSVDTSWRINVVNRRAEQCLAKLGETLLGETLWGVLPQVVGRSGEAELRRAARERSAVQFETNEFLTGLWHACTATPEPGGLSIFFDDITAKKAHLEQLERLVDDRTAALQRVISELESFSYTLVHDMRAPLRSISSFAEILAVDHAAQLNPDGKRFLERIQNSASRMDQLIIDILDYSQLSRRKPELHLIDLDEVIRELVRSDPMLQPEKADIAIEGVLPKIRGNDALLAQCFSNLLHNATKFVASGVKPRIRISAQVTGSVTRVDVTDNGIGIAPEATSRIFEPFRREHPHYDGTGIGLAIVRKVVEQLNGRVGVDSHVGQGSRFWVELQLAGVESAAPSEQDVSRVLV
jgi:signal transduction histidine kinase